MSGLCGWLGAEWGGRDPEEAMAAMASGLAVEAGTTAWSDTAPERGLYAAGPPSACHVHADGAVLAAIVGQPRWLDSDLVDLAAREGHAKSLALAYEQHGRRLFTALRGSWALAVIDAGRGRLLAAVDRLAVHRLCYATPPRGVVLGTTVDAVAVHPSIDTSIDPQAIFDYLFFEYIPAPATIYGEIRKLLPGQCLWYENGAARLDFYWRMPYVDRTPSGSGGDIDTLAADVREALDGAMDRALDGADPSQVGTFLSGGVDSSTLTGLLAKRAPGQVHAYSIGFDAAGYDELEFARTAARHFKVDLHEYYVTPEDVISFVPTMARIYDEPYGNSSAAPAYYCAKMAQERGTRMLLAGDGGDELFAGNERYVRQRFFDAYDVLPHALRASFIEPVIERWPGGAALYPVRKARSYIKQANTPLPDRLHYYNYFGTITAAQCFAPGVGADTDARHPLTTMREHYRDNPSRSPLQRMMNLDLRMTIADDDLRKVGGTARSAGIDVRFPLLDDDVVELAARVPPKLQVRWFRLRHFFKYAMRDFLPKSTLTKSKHGFGLPFGLWLKSSRPLQELTYDCIGALGRRDLFLPEFLESAVAAHKGGHPSYHGELVWALMMLEMWLQNHASGAFARAEAVPDIGHRSVG